MKNKMISLISLAFILLTSCNTLKTNKTCTDIFSDYMIMPLEIKKN